MDEPETMGSRIKRWRTKRNMSQRKLAQAAGVDVSWISRLETGDRLNISLDGAKRICQALGISLDYLAGMYDENGDPKWPTLEDPRDGVPSRAVPCPCGKGTMATSVAHEKGL
jgi:transcriptional regulator with XRE-family HTH domain